MALTTGLSLKQSQRIALTPQLRQSLSLLRMPMLDLVAHIRSEAAENPLLLLSEPTARNKYGANAFDYALNHVAATITLGESIRQQLSLLALDARTKEIAIYLTGDLSEDGFLETTALEVETALGAPHTLVKGAIAAIQSCEPTGVGARDLHECLLLQLVEKGVESDVAQGVLDNIDLLLAGKWPALAKLLDISTDDLQTLAALLRTLNPKPVAGFGTEAAPLSVDVIVAFEEKRGLTITLPDHRMPQLSLNTTLLEHAKSDAAAESYVGIQRARAQALIGALRYRSETLLRVTRAIIAHQHRFFMDGPDHLAPLSRVSLARELSLHPTTIGRTIAEKNLEYNGVIYPLGFFLPNSLRQGETGQISAYCVQQSIRRMIAQETAAKTLSDEEIVKELRRNGVDIARRTVAKYRGCMKIPSSFQRRRLLTARRTRPNFAGGVKHPNN